MTDVVIGIDVSVRRGLDAVVLDAESKVVEARAALVPNDLVGLIERWQPGAIAIDSPPGPGRQPGGTSRECERALCALGINAFFTPSDPARFSKPFYDWVRVGMRAFDVAATAGYPVQQAAVAVRGRALEVFPHASDVFFRNRLPPAGTIRRVRSKRAWRLGTLHLLGMETDRLCVNRVGEPTIDSIDAALAALTARHALAGNYCALGAAGEWIIVPGAPGARFVR